MPPKLNRRRALFVLSKIDEILAWEQRKEAERDTRFVELGRYLCEVRAGQYWRLENLKSFDEFLESIVPRLRAGRWRQKLATVPDCLRIWIEDPAGQAKAAYPLVLRARWRAWLRYWRSLAWWQAPSLRWLFDPVGEIF
jgi:hypothetical protein